MSTLRPWSTKSSEQKWAIAVAIGCFIILLTLPFWSGNKQNPENKGHQVQVANVTSQQIAPIRTQKAPPKKVTTKPAVSHTKQDSKKVAISAKPHVTPIQKTKKTVVSKVSQAYFIQVGAFQDKTHAQKLQKRLLKKRWPVIIQKKKRFYAVQIGPYKQKEKANSIKKQISHKEKINGFITHHAYP